jgi:ABC-type phosphate transport system auxiliary subunit
MDDEATLGHLLRIEAEAAALVSDAQAEADRRIDEGEKQSRAEYEKRYGAEAGRLEAEFQKEKELVKARYQKELEGCREKLNTIHAEQDRFAAALEAFLAEEA